MMDILWGTSTNYSKGLVINSSHRSLSQNLVDSFGEEDKGV